MNLIVFLQGNLALVFDPDQLPFRINIFPYIGDLPARSGFDVQLAGDFLGTAVIVLVIELLYVAR